MTSHSLFPMLITGVAGVAGYNALDYFSGKHPGQVIGTRRVDNWKLRGEGIRPLNAYDADGMKRLFDEHEFAWVLNCEGTCKLKSCEYDPENARRINVESVDALIAAAPATTRIVTLSIDLVFSGSGEGNHVEEDQTDPVTVYGETMVDAEQMFASERPDACILRISLPMGVSFNGHAGAIDWIQSRFAKSLPATLYYDEIRTPTYTDCLNHSVRSGHRQRSVRHLSRRRAAPAQLVRDRPDHQPPRRLWSGLSDGSTATGSRTDSTASRQRDDEFGQVENRAGI